jgi:hypothetical protein
LCLVVAGVTLGPGAFTGLLQLDVAYRQSFHDYTEIGDGPGRVVRLVNHVEPAFGYEEPCRFDKVLDRTRKVRLRLGRAASQEFEGPGEARGEALQ